VLKSLILIEPGGCGWKNSTKRRLKSNSCMFVP